MTDNECIKGNAPVQEMKSPGEFAVQIHLFLTSATDTGERSGSRANVFEAGKTAPVIHCIRGFYRSKVKCQIDEIG